MTPAQVRNASASIRRMAWRDHFRNTRRSWGGWFADQAAAARAGRLKPPLCRRNTAGVPLLTAQQVRTIRAEHRRPDGPSQVALAAAYGVTPVAIWKIVHNATYKEVK